MTDHREVLGHLLGNDQIMQAKIADALTQAAAAVQDAHDERDHWRKMYGMVQQEVLVMASVLLKQKGGVGRKLVIRLSEFQQIAPDMQLHVEVPGNGVRVYSLRRMERKDDAKVVLQ